MQDQDVRGGQPKEPVGEFIELSAMGRSLSVNYLHEFPETEVKE